jgi:hypothetical protein
MPLIPLEIFSPMFGRFVVVHFLVDSGADVSALPKELALETGLEEEELQGDASLLEGIGGSIRIRKTTLRVKMPIVHNPVTFEMDCRVLQERRTDGQEPFPTILGRRQFFERFDITFKEAQRKIQLKRA